MAPDQHKTRKPVQKRGIETRGKILDAAMRLFSKKGFHSTNTKEIAREAGVATGSFYAYFKDKKSVFLEIYKGISHKQLKDMAGGMAGVEGQDDTGRVEALLRALAGEHGFSPNFQREVSAMRYSDPDVEALHNSIHEGLGQEVALMLEKQKERLRVKDLDAAAFVILCACEEVIHTSRTISHRIDRDRVISNLADMIARFLYK
ncbi:MAG: TetR/AcrR family transcriptional regulator [Desulfobacteraceae bacterium]|nr:TetR/AcrR family transcriptional regulator [Desulfobacteraceae bacterium]